MVENTKHIWLHCSTEFSSESSLWEKCQKIFWFQFLIWICCWFFLSLWALVPSEFWTVYWIKQILWLCHLGWLLKKIISRWISNSNCQLRPWWLWHTNSHWLVFDLHIYLSHVTGNIVNLFCAKTSENHTSLWFPGEKLFTSHPKRWKLCELLTARIKLHTPPLWYLYLWDRICFVKLQRNALTHLNPQLCRTQPETLAVLHELQLAQTSILRSNFICFLFFLINFFADCVFKTN